MSSPRHSIKNKLMFIYMVAILLALLIAGGAFIAQDIYSIRHTLTERLTIQSKIIGSNASVAILFDDRESALEILQALKADQEVLSATIIKNGKNFVHYKRQHKKVDKPSWLMNQFFEPLLIHKHAVFYKNRVIAEITLTSDHPTLHKHFNIYLKITALVLLFSFLFSFIIAILMQRPFLIPIMYLVEITQKVARKKDYSLKVLKTTDDELGELADNFNIMLEQINHRDKNLEDIVEKRTNELVYLNKKLNYRADHDALTGLANRDLFNDHIKQALARAKRHQKQFAIIFIDLDNFKIINDTMGHEYGDIILCEAAKRLSRCVRKEDTLARMGGDEFTILLNQISRPENVITFVEKILHAFEKPFTELQHNFHVKPSMGISIYPEDGDEASLLQRNADTAMYAAKEEGGNGYQLFSRKMSEKVHKRMSLEAELHTALSDDQLLLHYQPQTNAQGQTVGFEALIRWLHPLKGMIPPLDFISIAEETGQIIAIGYWVIEQACKQQKIWRRQGYKLVPIHINLSPKQFIEPRLGQNIVKLLDEYDLSADLIGCEVTENTFAQDIEKSITLLNELHQSGLHLSIDDFGTGYSSLGYLKSFPIDSLKIDQSFIRDMSMENEDAALVKGIINLAHSLNLSVVAEGVETAEQQEFLIAHHCNILQGYYFSKPLPEDEVTKWLTRSVIKDLT